MTQQVGALAERVFGNQRAASGLLRAEGVRYLTHLVSGGFLQCIEADPDYPRFVTPLSTKLQWGLPAVDCHYLAATIRGGGSYRIHGQRGSARIFDIEVYEGHVSDFSTYRLRSKSQADFAVSADGCVEFVLSPGPRNGNWLEIPADGRATVLVRQYMYDWDSEEPGLLFIEREDASYPPPQLTEADLARRMDDFRTFLANVPAACERAVESYFLVDGATMEFQPIPFAFSDLMFGRGHYRCEPDEAVLVEVPAPDCEYWNYQLANQFWQALDWNVRQTTLNGHQAVLDADGWFRAVIAHVDPGVPNWLDTAGRPEGLLAARYYRASEIVPPKLTRVALAEVRDRLPPGTPTMTAEQRQEALRRRMIAARRTWRE